MQLRRPLGVIVACALVLAAGCSPSTVKLSSVTGRVTKGGQPQANLVVEFIPAESGRSSQSATDSDGRYELVYSFDKKGAAPGQYRVHISERNGDASTEIMIVDREVTSGTNVHDFDLAEAK